MSTFDFLISFQIFPAATRQTFSGATSSKHVK
jgi:hypothetical protein